jgi:hypothetical protein
MRSWWTSSLKNSAAVDDVRFQPLRIPSGWTVDWNTFYEEDPCEDNFIVFDGSSLFAATHRGAKVSIDMEFHPKNLEEGNTTLHILSMRGRN